MIKKMKLSLDEYQAMIDSGQLNVKITEKLEGVLNYTVYNKITGAADTVEEYFLLSKFSQRTRELDKEMLDLKAAYDALKAEKEFVDYINQEVTNKLP